MEEWQAEKRRCGKEGRVVVMRRGPARWSCVSRDVVVDAAAEQTGPYGFFSSHVIFLVPDPTSANLTESRAGQLDASDPRTVLPRAKYHTVTNNARDLRDAQKTLSVPATGALTTAIRRLLHRTVRVQCSAVRAHRNGPSIPRNFMFVYSNGIVVCIIVFIYLCAS